jgi:hypothetical protein
MREEVPKSNEDNNDNEEMLEVLVYRKVIIDNEA